jgi:hypothetical protein
MNTLCSALVGLLVGALIVVVMPLIPRRRRPKSSDDHGAGQADTLGAGGG